LEVEVMIRKRSLLMLAILTVVIVIAAWGYHHRRHSFKQAETHPMWQAIEKAGTVSLHAHDLQPISLSRI
jgi:hypothetical protein